MRIHRCSQSYFGVEQLDQRLRHGLVGYWKFNEGSGLTACDLSGKRNHGSINGPIWSLGREHIDNALSFDGVDDYVYLGNPASLQPSPNITFSLWFNFTTAQIEKVMIRKRSYGYSIKTDATNGNKIRVVICTSSTVDLDWTSSVLYNDGKWHFAVATCDGNELKVYVDGNLEGTVTGGAGAIYYGSGGIAIGRDGDYDGGYFNGLIDDVRIYNRAAEIGEIKAHYCAGLDRLLANGLIDQQEYQTRIAIK